MIVSRAIEIELVDLMLREITDREFFSTGDTAGERRQFVGEQLYQGRFAVAVGAEQGDAVIGVNAVLFPDVRVGENAGVAAGAVVVRGTRIGNNEVWGGIPAKKIGRPEARPPSIPGASSSMGSAAHDSDVSTSR